MKNYPSKNAQVNGIFRRNLDTIATVIASNILGMAARPRIFHTSLRSVSISSESPARHKITQNAVFLKIIAHFINELTVTNFGYKHANYLISEEVPRAIESPTIDITGTFLNKIPTMSIPIQNK